MMQNFQKIAGKHLNQNIVCSKELKLDKAVPESVKPLGEWFHLAQRNDDNCVPVSEFIVESKTGIIAEWTHAWKDDNSTEEDLPSYYLLDLTLSDLVKECDFSLDTICPNIDRLGKVTFEIEWFDDDDETYRKLKKHLYAKLDHVYHWKEQRRTAQKEEQMAKLCGNHPRAMSKLEELAKRGLIKKAG